MQEQRQERVEHRVAVIPGDGIGTEVVPAAQRVLERAGELYGFSWRWTELDWSCERYTRTGAMMPQDGLAQLAEHDQIFLGAVGYPGVPDHVALWGLLIPIRRAFEQYVNLRPVRLLRRITSLLRTLPAHGLDFVVVRENSEGEYSEIGGRLLRGTPREAAIQETVVTRVGVERVVRYAMDLAGRRHGRLTSATKSNGIIHTMPFWDEIVGEVTQGSGLDVSSVHIDALAAMFVLDPGRFDVVVASNLFGDILTDLGAAIIGSIGIAPSANLNPEREFPSMFEPVHGSAPDIAGQGRANPVGQIWSGVMMLEHGADLGGTASTSSATDAVLAALEASARTEAGR